jgi:excisionase family DNA binding protein
MPNPIPHDASTACERLGIKRSTLQQWLDKGWIEGAQLSSGAWIFTDDQLEQAAANRAAAAQPKAATA